MHYNAAILFLVEGDSSWIFILQTSDLSSVYWQTSKDLTSFTFLMLYSCFFRPLVNLIWQTFVTNMCQIYNLVLKLPGWECTQLDVSIIYRSLVPKLKSIKSKSFIDEVIFAKVLNTKLFTCLLSWSSIVCLIFMIIQLNT